MGAPPARLTAPLLVVVRSGAEPAERTVQALDAVLNRRDRLVLAVDGGHHPVDLSAALRRLRAEAVPATSVPEIARAHAEAGGAVVVLDDGAHGFGKHWLSGLVAAAVEAGGAALPATNAAPWPACPPGLPDAAAPRNEWRDFARALAGRPAVAVAGAAEMAGPAVALAPSTVGVWAETTDLAPAALAALAALAGMVVRAEGVYVHDDGARVLVSACLIMKDEVENLARCLASVAPLVDEVVIYDTGSSDDSVALARSLGAVVIEGEWHDDFARARNEARRHCRGTWLLHIDADEEIEAPRAAVAARDLLARDLPVDVLAVPLHNLRGTELAPSRGLTPLPVPRLLQRTRCHWTGALHEHPMPVRGGTPVIAEGPPSLVLLHYGYLDEVMARRGKVARNTRIAEGPRDDEGDAGRAHFDRARTLSSADRHDDALAEYRAAAESARHPIHRRCAWELGATVLLAQNRPDEAESWIVQRELVPERPGVGRWLRARQALCRGRHADALALLDGISDYTDNFSTNGADGVHLMRAQAHLGLGDLDRAGGELLAAVELNPALDRAWDLLIRHAADWPDRIARATAALPPDQLKLFAGKLLGAPPDQAGIVAECLWAAHPGAPVLLALAVALAPQLALEEAARWAMRLRAAGHAARCPLTAIATNPLTPPVLRLQAAYLGAELFGDPALVSLQAELAELLPAG